MKRTRMLPLLFTVAASLMMYVGSALAAEHEHVLKVGKTGEVTFNNETKVGDLTLKPGRYKLQHRVEGSDHFVHFTEWTKQNPYSLASGGPKAHPGEVKCQLEPLHKRVSSTAVYSVQEDGAARVTKVEVAGENVAHLF